MNSSTIKKAVAYSMLSALSFSFAKAQTSGSSQVFGGTSQYRTWTFGINGGVTSPSLLIGGTTDFNSKDLGLGYGISIRKQLNHTLGFQGDIHRGVVKGHNEFSGNVAQRDAAFTAAGASRFRVDLTYAASISAVTSIGSVDFLHRDNGLNFFVNAGWGIAAYKPWVSSAHAGGVAISDGDLKKEFDAAKDAGLQYGTNKDKDNIHEQFFPVGLGAKFKLSDKIGLVLGYTMNFLDGDNLDNYQAKYTTKDKWSYGYAGLDFSLGDGSKPNLDWVNPVAVLYDDLKDPSLRQEVEALKGRVSTLENTVNQLSADADGDGVSNKFDKCANTPAGSIVDGAGCPIKFPEPVVQNTTSYPSTYSNIMFEFDSSVLKTSSYPTLDQLSADLKANPSAQLTLNGYASAEGTEAYNLRLSDDRANSVKTYLVNSGVDASRITTKPYGEANPVASNATEEGRIQNRRVEIRK